MHTVRPVIAGEFRRLNDDKFIRPNRVLAHNAKEVIFRFSLRNNNKWSLLGPELMDTEINIRNERVYPWEEGTTGWVLISSYDTNWGRLYVHVWRD